MNNSSISDSAPAPHSADRLAQKWGVTPAPPRMVLEDFRPIRKNSLLGFARVRLPIGLVIADVPVCSSHGKVWAAMPSRPALDPSGRQVEKNGKRVYVPVLSWADRTTADRWSAAVVELVRAAHPDAFEDAHRAARALYAPSIER